MENTLTEQLKKAKNRRMAYIGLIIVILIWGTIPLVTLHFYQYYSPTIRLVFVSLICAISLLIFSAKRLKELNKTYFLVAIPTGCFMAFADIFQKIGLLYTTPTHYAFLENLSCIIVPFLLFLFIKKKPSFLSIFSAFLCLLSSFILSDIFSTSGGSLLGDFLCAMAGICFGVNIAGTGAFAKKLYAPLYLMIQMFTEMIITLVAAIVFHQTGIEKIVFNFDWRLILANISVAILSSTICWVIRTNAMKHVDATVVAVMMPFSAVITTIASLILGKDTLSFSLVISVILGLIAIILSGLGDKPMKKASA